MKLPALPIELCATDLAPLLKPRARHSHKGDYGHVLVIGGDKGMPGAVRLAAEAAYRMGAGLVSVATHQEHIAVVATARPEVMVHAVVDAAELEPLLAKATVVILGPGLGLSAWSYALYAKAIASHLPMLIDADGLNILAKQPTSYDNWVLTPHPGEAGRLLDMPLEAVQADRLVAIQSLQQRYQGTVVLKGAGTLIASAGKPYHLCSAGNPGMASGGMGDALSGIIGGFMAQGLSLDNSAQLGVYIHSVAADRLTKREGERGLLALDVIQEARVVCHELAAAGFVRG